MNELARRRLAAESEWEEHPPDGGGRELWSPCAAGDDVAGCIVAVRKGTKTGAGGKETPWEFVDFDDHNGRRLSFGVAPHVRRQIDSILKRKPRAYEPGAALYVRCLSEVEFPDGVWMRCAIMLWEQGE